VGCVVVGGGGGGGVKGGGCGLDGLRENMSVTLSDGCSLIV